MMASGGGNRNKSKGGEMTDQQLGREPDSEDARVRTTADAVKPKSPPAPGARLSPQQPGMTPDRSSVPGHVDKPVGRPASKRRPLTQYGTAEEIMRVFKKTPEEQLEPGHFEQATASYEELRKAYPRELPPVRPARPTLAAGEEPAALPAGNSEF
jgi:hypothetical protein